MEPERQQDFAGVPDSFQRLWTPHRMVYIDSHDDEGALAGGCPFCLAPDTDDEAKLVVRRGELAFVIMNLFPYSPGHLLVCPYRHFADYDAATPEETAEIAALAQQAMRTLRAVSHPAGFNLGFNQGAVAGAGVAGHLHQHVVPRWLGDTNFLPIVAQTRALPQLLGDARQRLADAWEG